MNYSEREAYYREKISLGIRPIEVSRKFIVPGISMPETEEKRARLERISEIMRPAFDRDRRCRWMFDLMRTATEFLNSPERSLDDLEKYVARVIENMYRN